MFVEIFHNMYRVRGAYKRNIKIINYRRKNIDMTFFRMARRNGRSKQFTQKFGSL